MNWDSSGKVAPRVGLVLEGGGAKGAYAMGCILAFRDLGLTFTAIAGTSVGSLNAAILSTGQLEFGEQFWRSLSFRQVCKPSRYLPFWFLLPFHFIAIILNPWLNNLRTPLRVGLGVWGCLLGFVIALTSLFVGIAWLSGDDPWNVYLQLRYMPILIIGMAFLGLLPQYITRRRLAVFTVAPLGKAIEQYLVNWPYQIPVYVTLGERPNVFDPDQPHLMVAGTPSGARFIPTDAEMDVPKYLRLDSLIPDERKDALLASAALPFGIFPGIKIGSSQYIDGGLADNTPIYPLIAVAGCDVIIIVRLRPNTEGFVEKHWQDVDRRLRVAESSVEEAKSQYNSARIKGCKTDHTNHRFDPPINIPFNPFPTAVTIFVIAPEKSLGNFLSGTMNFRAKYANQLVDRGYADAFSILASVIHKLKTST